MKIVEDDTSNISVQLTLIVQVVNERKRLKYEKLIDEDNIPCPGEPKKWFVAQSHFSKLVSKTKEVNTVKLV